MKKKSKKKIHWGQRLRKAIDDKGLIVESVAKRIGISDPTLYTRMKDGKFNTEQLAVVRGIVNSKY